MHDLKPAIAPPAGAAYVLSWQHYDEFRRARGVVYSEMFSGGLQVSVVGTQFDDGQLGERSIIVNGLDRLGGELSGRAAEWLARTLASAALELS